MESKCTHLIGVDDEIVACDVIVLPDGEIIADQRKFSPNDVQCQVLERDLLLCHREDCTATPPAVGL
jgi:hypothetical protein